MRRRDCGCCFGSDSLVGESSGATGSVLLRGREHSDREAALPCFHFPVDPDVLDVGEEELSDDQGTRPKLVFWGR